MCVCLQCLRKDAESRRRELHIRTYAVIPLNEECGIIEWVNNTAGLRHILTKLYKERGISLHKDYTSRKGLTILVSEVKEFNLVVYVGFYVFSRDLPLR